MGVLMSILIRISPEKHFKVNDHKSWIYTPHYMKNSNKRFI